MPRSKLVRIGAEFGDLEIEVEIGGRTLIWNPSSLGSEGADETEVSEWTEGGLVAHGVAEKVGIVLATHAGEAIDECPRNQLLTLARVLRDTHCARLAVEVAKRYARQHPSDVAAPAVICSAYRRFDSRAALVETRSVRNPTVPLLVSQSAAWLDLGEAIAARLIVQLASGRHWGTTRSWSEHAGRVLRRIRAIDARLEPSHWARDRSAADSLNRDCINRHGVSPGLAYLTPGPGARPSDVDPRLVCATAEDRNHFYATI